MLRGGASLTGLSAAEAAARLREEGPNTIPGARRPGLARLALDVLREPILLLLCAAAAVYLVIGDLAEALILSASVVVVIAISVGQRARTERALEALRDLSSPRARVVRDGAQARIAGAEVVRGDLLILSEGDRVAADARLLEASDLMADESLLTGESLAVAKDSSDKGQGGEVYSGTLIVRGHGRAEVFATGARSELGRIGRMLSGIEPEKTSLEIETGRIVRRVAAFAVILSVVVALMYALLRGGWVDSVLAGLTLAMAILPEEYPVVLTVFLALGAWRIARRDVLTRRMPAIEMLGAATVLCVDKTGTLTENRMAVKEVRAGEERAVLAHAALASELSPFDPMESAILAMAAERAPEAVEWRKTWRLDRDYALSEGFLAVCHAWRDATGRAVVAIKGAPETVIAACRLTAAEGEALLAEARRSAEQGMRILGVASSQWPHADWPADPRAFPFVWLGFVALADPLRPAVPDAVAECRRAGIRVVMVTGDHAGTALAIAREAGIRTDGGVLTGAQLQSLPETELTHAVRSIDVFARVLPEQKLRLVEALKSAGEIVAMTGDGVNDAPALGAAHIGVAMGGRGTDVAREAAALVLLRDEFGAIVDTVRLGRRIYDNLRNAMGYLLAVHVPIAGISFLPLVLGGPIVLYPVHVVFLEFVIDPACSLAFEAERGEREAMRRPPRNPGEPLFSRSMLVASLSSGAAVLLAVVLTYAWAFRAGMAQDEMRALVFAAIVIGNVGLIFANRSRFESIAATLARPNPALWWVTLGALAALALAVYVPPLAGVFRFEPLGTVEVGIAVAAGLAGAMWSELWKRSVRRRGP
ncbi:MAG TPA: cation-translocating P-type ATPase [Burkholderiales bacterium]|nr:cation-translocating P-type ATPase [Burkholderiales bacterium]